MKMRKYVLSKQNLGVVTDYLRRFFKNPYLHENALNQIGHPAKLEYGLFAHNYSYPRVGVEAESYRGKVAIRVIAPEEDYMDTLFLEGDTLYLAEGVIYVEHESSFLRGWNDRVVEKYTKVIDPDLDQHDYIPLDSDWIADDWDELDDDYDDESPSGMEICSGCDDSYDAYYDDYDPSYEGRRYEDLDLDCDSDFDEEEFEDEAY